MNSYTGAPNHFILHFLFVENQTEASFGQWMSRQVKLGNPSLKMMIDGVRTALVRALDLQSRFERGD